MIESGCISSELPDLDRTDDPRGGAAAWALLTMCMVFLGVIVLTAMWTTGG
jgi:hypothetical protein